MGTVHFGMERDRDNLVIPVCRMIRKGDVVIDGNLPGAKEALAETQDNGSLCFSCGVVIMSYKQGFDDGIESVTGHSRAERTALPCPRSRMLH